MVTIITPNKDQVKSLYKDIRKRSNSKETKTLRENRYGHNLVTLKYYKDGEKIARVLKTDGEIAQIAIYEPSDN